MTAAPVPAGANDRSRLPPVPENTRLPLDTTDWFELTALRVTVAGSLSVMTTTTVTGSPKVTCWSAMAPMLSEPVPELQAASTTRTAHTPNSLRMITGGDVRW